MTECLNNTTPKELSETDRAKLRKIRHVAFDMDGTIYMGSTLFPYTQETLKRLRENGIGYSFLTNRIACYRYVRNRIECAIPDVLYSGTIIE